MRWRSNGSRVRVSHQRRKSTGSTIRLASSKRTANEPGWPTTARRLPSATRRPASITSSFSPTPSAFVTLCDITTLVTPSSSLARKSRNTESESSKAEYWKTTRRCRRARRNSRGASWFMHWPRTWTSPCDGRSKPTITRSNVVLPAPDPRRGRRCAPRRPESSRPSARPPHRARARRRPAESGPGHGALLEGPGQENEHAACHGEAPTLGDALSRRPASPPSPAPSSRHCGPGDARRGAAGWVAPRASPPQGPRARRRTCAGDAPARPLERPAATPPHRPHGEGAAASPSRLRRRANSAAKSALTRNLAKVSR